MKKNLKKSKTCLWTVEADGMCASDCGEVFLFNADGTPKENRFKFCPFCGKPIREKKV